MFDYLSGAPADHGGLFGSWPVDTQPTFFGHLEVITQSCPYFRRVYTTLDKVIGGTFELTDYVRVRYPRSSYMPKFIIDELLELRYPHGADSTNRTR